MIIKILIFTLTLIVITACNSGDIAIQKSNSVEAGQELYINAGVEADPVAEPAP